LDRDAPNFEPTDAPIRTFRRLLLAKCEYEFENRILGQSTTGNPIEDDMIPQEARIQARKKAIGNIKLIGELGKLDLVSEAILHKCLKTLLKRGTNENLSERCEDLECLTKIMQTVGKKLDQGQGKNLMDQYLERIKKIQTQKDLPIRLKFILQDIVDLRSNHWIPRLAFIEKETKLTDEDGNQQTQITYKYQPTIPSLTNPLTYPFHTSSSPTSLFQRPPFHPSILQRPRGTQVTSDRYQFERLNPLSTEVELPNSSTSRQTYRSNNSPKSRLRQHDNLTNPFDNSSKDNESSHKLPNGNSNRQSNSPTFTNGLTNGGSKSSSFNLRPKQSFNPRIPMTDREEMESPIIPKTTNDLTKKPTSEILANHPLTKNMNNLSSLIKSKDTHHHHHHHSSTNKNLSQIASSMTRDELFSKYNSFIQMSFDDFENILNQLRSLKLSKNQIIEFIQYLFDQSLYEHNKNILFLVRLIIYLHKNTFITNNQCLHVLTNILSKIHDYEKELSLFKSELATLIANIIWMCLTNEQDGKLFKPKKSKLFQFYFRFINEE
jgi:translation initiation factor 4G